jgi:hypothetical protein
VPGYETRRADTHFSNNRRRNDKRNDKASESNGAYTIS